MIRIILDTDLAMGAPGSDIDDGFALALAHADPDIQIELVTTVNGNTDVESATLLGLELADRLGAGSIPVVMGASAPLLRPDLTRRAPDPIRERYGHRVPQEGHAPQRIVELVMANPGEITVVAIGPLTNIAVALALDPGFASAVKEIVIMGGIFLGQTNKAAMPGEFNVWVDPEAAYAVLHSGAPLRWVGLDVTMRVRLTRDDALKLSAGAGGFASFAGECTTAWIDHLAAANPGDHSQADSCAMHDPLAVAVLTRPDLVTWADAHVDVITGDGTGRGVMIADLLTSDRPPAPNCRIATDVDASAFREHFLGMLSRL